MKICQVCGSEFSGATVRARFCGDRCRQISHRSKSVTERILIPVVQPELGRSVTGIEVRRLAESIARSFTAIKWHADPQFRLPDVDAERQHLAQLLDQGRELTPLAASHMTREFDWTMLETAILYGSRSLAG